MPHQLRVDVVDEQPVEVPHAAGVRVPRPVMFYEGVLLMDLVRMAGLLQSAAECQTGRYIVCPPDLMTRLRRQQGVVEGEIASLPATR